MNHTTSPLTRIGTEVTLTPSFIRLDEMLLQEHEQSVRVLLAMIYDMNPVNVDFGKIVEMSRLSHVLILGRLDDEQLISYTVLLDDRASGRDMRIRVSDVQATIGYADPEQKELYERLMYELFTEVIRIAKELGAVDVRISSDIPIPDNFTELGFEPRTKLTSYRAYIG